MNDDESRERREHFCKSVLAAIKKGKLRAGFGYAYNQGGRCLTCAIGAAIAYQCDFKPSCVFKWHQSPYYHQQRCTTAINEEGFTTEQSHALEDFYEGDYEHHKGYSTNRTTRLRQVYESLLLTPNIDPIELGAYNRNAKPDLG